MEAQRRPPTVQSIRAEARGQWSALRHHGGRRGLVTARDFLPAAQLPRMLEQMTTEMAPAVMPTPRPD